MTDEEIDKLAREYATSMCKEFADLSDRAFDGMVEATTIPYKEFLLWLLRSHCIVPKSVVREEWEGLENQGDMCMEIKAMAGVLAVGGQMSMLLRLFGPQPGKEETE